MLNTSIKLGDTNVTFNTPCTGMIQKSHPKSNFMRFHKTSKIADWIFSDCPRLQEETYKCDKIIVLQVMCYGNEWILMEYVYEKDILIMQKEDKLKKKAIEAHRQSCPQWNCCKHRVGKPTCTKECGYMEKFILLLNN